MDPSPSNQTVPELTPDGVALVEGAILAIQTLQQYGNDHLQVVIGLLDLMCSDPALPDRLRTLALVAQESALQIRQLLDRLARLRRLQLQAGEVSRARLIDLERFIQP